MSMHSIGGNICIIGPFPEDASLMKGGVQASVYGHAHAMRAYAGADTVKVISLPVAATGTSAIRRLSSDGVDILYLSARRFLADAIIHLPRILREACKPEIRLVHIHGTGLVQTALIILLRMKKTRYVWTLHGITEKETLQKYRAEKSLTNLTRHFFYTFLERLSARCAPHIMVDTSYVASEISAAGNITVIPNGGIFSEEFSSIPSPVSNPPVILSLGVLKPRKGHHHTLAAFAIVKQKIPDATLVIAGASPDGRYLASLKEKALCLGISGAVQFRLNLPRMEILKLYAGAKIFALHSEEESQGLAICEAMAAGLPVVATQVGGIPFVVMEGKSGLLVPYGDAAEFAEAICSLLADDERYEKMSHVARIASRRFDWRHITDEFTAVYSRVLSRSAG